MKTNTLYTPENGYSIVTGKQVIVNTNSLRTAEPFKSLFPIREADLDKIADDMKKHGFDHAHPIIVWAGHKFTVVDGHTRLAAARRLGIDAIPVVVREFGNENDALEYAIDSQRNRRNLSDAEMMRCLSALDKRRKTGRPKDSDVIHGKSADATAYLLGTSRCKVEKLRTINDYAPQTIKLAVLSGSISANRAYIITMETRRIENCKNTAEFKSERLAVLEKSISKGIRERTELELLKHPGVRYSTTEIHAMKGRIISKLDEALGKLKKGKK